jgi:hypothetical protein
MHSYTIRATRFMDDKHNSLRQAAIRVGRFVSLISWTWISRLPGIQRFTVWQHHLYETADGLAILYWLDSNRFHDPMRNIGTVILDVITQEAVRVGPEPLRDRALHDHLFPRVEG